MMQKLRWAALMVAALGLGACDDNLDVENPNSPDAGRALATPGDAENMMASYYKRWHDGLYRNLGNVEGMANIMSFQNYSDLANNCQNQRFPMSGAINNNAIGNTCGGEQVRLYQVQSEVNRVASTLLTKMEEGLTLGTPGQDARFKAMGEFLRGVSLGYLALFHDSAAVISVGMPAEDPGTLSSYDVVMDSALVALQNALDHTATPGFVALDANWIPAPASLSATDFARLIRSYRARLRANVARNPAERAAVNWDAVIADAENGITENHINITNTTNGPFRTWVAQYDTYGLWHQMPPWVIGMGDVSGNYAAWIGTPVSSRGAGNTPFFMVTPDLRFPQGATRAEQQADFPITSCQGAAQTCKRYFANRIGNDQFNSLGWGWSNYDFVRFHSWRIAGDAGSGQNGAMIFMTRAEMDMLAAEGHIRKGNYAAAAALINKTRVPNGLEAITALDGTSPVPGGANCVPKVPVGPSFSTVDCGNMLEAMKWEKRIETAYTHFAAWFLDHRGWGDLAEGTPLFWPVPYQDLQARGALPNQIYSTGDGVGTAPNSSAARGTYGW
ncbi:MAG TPA: hypothetical protein VFZ21_32545 [Gemmatimonadaceae bacterium]|jgi:hypothetical protein|nr:hypothetical protein [Gemmatimonadaceae bacterium]